MTAGEGELLDGHLPISLGDQLGFLFGVIGAPWLYGHGLWLYLVELH